MSFKFKLQHILFLSFTLIASLPVIILGYWVQQAALEHEVSAVKEKHLLLAKNVTRDISRYLLDVENSFNLIISNLDSTEHIQGIDKHLKNLEIRYIHITDFIGNITNTIPNSQTTGNKLIEPKIWKLLKTTVSDAIKTEKIMYSNLIRTSGNETSFFIVKKISKNRLAIAVLSTAYIKTAQQTLSFGRRGHVAIVDRTGRAIAHPVDGWVKSMKDMSFLPPVIQMMKGNTGVSKFYTPAMHGDVIAGYTTVAATGWGVMVPQPFEELLERAESTQNTALTIIIIGIAIAGLISWYLSSLLVAPIRSVIHATKFSEKEKLKYINPAKISVSGILISKESQELFDSFNSMSNRLNDITAELYSKIDFSSKEVKEQNLKLKEQSEKLIIVNKELERLSTMDNLTNLYNRRLFDEMIDNEFSFSMRHKEFLSLIIIDIDKFKLINDKYGHIQGDKVLIEIANILKINIRSSDAVFRIGGEEFAILCRQTNYKKSLVVAENIRASLEDHDFNFNSTTFNATGSFGIVTIPNEDFDDDDVNSLYRYADMAMYHSKNSGKNRVTHYHDIK